MSLDDVLNLNAAFRVLAVFAGDHRPVTRQLVVEETGLHPTTVSGRLQELETADVLRSRVREHETKEWLIRDGWRDVAAAAATLVEATTHE